MCDVYWGIVFQRSQFENLQPKCVCWHATMLLQAATNLNKLDHASRSFQYFDCFMPPVIVSTAATLQPPGVNICPQ